MLQSAIADAIRKNWIDPKFLYITPRQSELWRRVFLKHSPIHGNPEFMRIYQTAFTQIASELPNQPMALIGLGCGTGLKELDLYKQLKSPLRPVQFLAIDVSRDLVAESVETLITAGANHERSLVCDLSRHQYIGSWLDRLTGDLPRVITFFGLVPNMTPSEVKQLFQSVLRPGDVLLASAHLAPAKSASELADAMESILPQYNNPETLAWLAAGLEEWGIKEQLEKPEMKIGEQEGVPAFLATARWKSGEGALQLFHSLRYTPESFEGVFREAGFELELLALTACREEGIWSIRRRN